MKKPATCRCLNRRDENNHFKTDSWVLLKNFMVQVA